MSEDSGEKLSREDVLRMAADIVSAYVSNNQVAATGVPEVINTVYRALTSLGDSSDPAPSEPLRPAVSIRRSINQEYLVCLEDGKKLKMLKRHLRTTYGLTPEEYRAKWKLPPDYPMVAPAYAKQRSDFAKKIGLGRKSAA